MNQLSEAQKQTVGLWVKEGASLSELQERIKSEWEIIMTYMDVRFLVDDLEVALQDPESEAEDDATDDAAASTKEATDAEAEFVGGGGVSISVDKIQRPGAVVSGDVTFSDGEACTWQVDQMGRLGIIPSKDGYQPPEQDMETFQMKLQEQLQKKGF